MPKDTLKRMTKSDIINALFRICYLSRLKNELTIKWAENCDKCKICKLTEANKGHDEVDRKMETDAENGSILCNHVRPNLFTLFDSYGLLCMDKIYKTPKIKNEIYEEMKFEIIKIINFCSVEIDENDIFHYCFELNAVGAVSNLNDNSIKQLMVILWK